MKEQVFVHHRKRIGLIGPTVADVRDTMIEGESGLMSIFPPGYTPHFQPSKRKVTFSNGAQAFLFSSEEPERLRGPQFEAAWLDELAAWKYPRETFDQLQFGLRLGQDPQQCITTTPKPLPILKEIMARPSTVISRGSSYENRANLAKAYIDEVIAPYEGTRLGRQELYAELLDDIEGALWRRDWIECSRIRQIPSRDLQRIVVAIDPAVTSNDNSDETGIVIAAKGVDGRGYVLDDFSCRLSADGWARRAVEGYETRRADKIIGEANNGGDLIERMIRLVSPKAAYKKVNASRGKIARAEPIAAMYERGQISHVGTFSYLEDELCSYTGKPGEKSPNRLDALVWALSELFVENQTVTPKVRYL